MIRLIPISPPLPADDFVRIPLLERLPLPGVLFEEWLKQFEGLPP